MTPHTPATSFWDDVAAAVRARRPLAVATIVRDGGSVPRRSGAKMLVFPDGSTRGSVGGGVFEMLVVRDARRALATGRSETRAYSFNPKGVEPEAFGAVCGGRAEVFTEVVMPRDRLLIVGGGHCGRALARAASLLDFDIVVADDREEYARAEDFALPNVTRVIRTSPSYEELPAVDRQTYVVLVSKGFITDEAALRRVIGGDAAYIGMIGSLRKRDTVFAELRKTGAPEEQIARVHSPIGLEIGADTPEEIAVSILAEVIQVRAAKRRAIASSEAAAGGAT